MKHVAVVVLGLLVLAGSAWAQNEKDLDDKRPGKPSERPPAAERTALEPRGEAEDGPRLWVGEKAPDFELEGSAGRPVRLSTLGGRWVLLVFDESLANLADLRVIQTALDTLGVRPCGICRDDGATLARFARNEGLRYLLLSDATGEVSQLYGMYDDDNEAIIPGIVLLDPKGVVRAVLLGQSLHAAEILQLARHSISGA